MYIYTRNLPRCTIIIITLNKCSILITDNDKFIHRYDYFNLPPPHKIFNTFVVVVTYELDSVQCSSIRRCKPDKKKFPLNTERKKKASLIFNSDAYSMYNLFLSLSTYGHD